ncbi:MAG: N,N-diacetylchitobiose phosphorylase [Clostridiales bacterium]|nr:N,N-diacetylchitobiose phosphorylase [Clostridiales bacterium]
MTGSGGWAYFSATRYMLGIRPDFDQLMIDPCIPKAWDEFEVTRLWRGAVYQIKVENPHGVTKGVERLYLDGVAVDKIERQQEGSIHQVRVIMGGAK